MVTDNVLRTGMKSQDTTLSMANSFQLMSLITNTTMIYLMLATMRSALQTKIISITQFSVLPLKPAQQLIERMKKVASYQSPTLTLTITKMPEVSKSQSMILVTSTCVTEIRLVF
jgi:hypothetical protein